jgi:glycosyltransferase involved in cell wall biosynthesis
MSHSKLKVLVHSNYSRLVTGFGKNMKNILLALHNDPDIEVFEAANGVKYGVDMMTPWKSFGTMPSDHNLLQMINNDPVKIRAAQYGFYTIDKIVEEVQPDVYLGIEDIWAFSEFDKKPWWNKTKKILWTTLDSLPILDQALQMEPKCDKMLVWATFAEKAMHELGHTEVETVHGAVDYSHFKPLYNRDELRRKHNLQDDYVIGFVFKNQLRKSVPNILEGFKIFKSENPNIKTKLLLHTDWAEKDMGWDIPRYIKEKNLDPKEILATYVCHRCDNYFLSGYDGEDKNCPCCNSEKSVKTKNSARGVREKELNEIYNIMDVYCHPFTSGGQELPIQEAKAAGLITLVTDYSCGTDSAYPHQGGLPLKWNEYREPSTQFIKATTCPNSIAEMLKQVYEMPLIQKQVLIENAKRHVEERFSVQTTVKKLKEIISNVKLKTKADEIFNNQQPTQSLEDILSDVELENRIAVVMGESGGDVLMINSMIENLNSLYPEKKIFVFTRHDFFDFINDNPFVYKLLPYTNQIDNLLALEGQGAHKGLFNIAFLPYIGTQRILNYMHNGQDKTQFELR